MKFIVINIFLLSFVTIGQSTIKDANKYYEEEKYQEAIDAYSISISNGNQSADLYYNLGNAYYRNNDIGHAIWGYESALKIDPDHEDALFNLEFTNAQTIDKISVSRQGLGHWIDGILYSESINFWAILSLVSSLILALTVLWFLKAQTVSRKNLALLSSSLITVLLICSFTFASLHKSRLNSKNEAIIVASTSNVKMSPTEDAATSFSLGAGAKVKLVQKDGEWQQIEINGNKGWVSIDDVWGI